MSNQTAGRGNNQVTSAGQYANVNGLKMYYEVHGAPQVGVPPQGGVPPLVLLHGSFSAIGTSFGALLPGLVQGRQVIAIEQQGHGHTGDIDRPLSVQQMGEDTVALLKQLGVQLADFFGYSLGSGIALYIAIRHPEMVRKQVLAGGVTYNRSGFYPGLLEGMEGLKPEYLVGSPFYDEYMASSPQPDDFPQLIEKVKGLNRNLPEWTADDIRAMQAPTMLVLGDSDIVPPEHGVEFFRLLGGGVIGDNVGLPKSRLAILPGTTHVTLVSRADWLVPMVGDFLAA